MTSITPDHPALQQARARLATTRIVDLFGQEANRADSFRCDAAGLTLDYAKQHLDAEGRNTLLALAEESSLAQAFQELVTGTPLNITEQRSALHTLLRGTGADHLTEEYRSVASTLARMKALVEGVHEGVRLGAAGDRFTDVINIGIGGSDLGPRMICRALHSDAPRLRPHFVANVDPQDLDETLAGLDPHSTLIIVCSKTFTTEETLTNARRARRWLIEGGVPEQAIEHHVVAVTSNVDAAVDFGIDAGQCYPMWDWVGGRYSLWSAVGLVIALHQGWDGFEALLAGAHAMDEHTRQTAPGDNLPMLLALLEYWNTVYLGAESHLVLPYAQRLSLLPDFLQQLTMESNGKRVTLEGDPVPVATAPVLWGSAGTIGQHSYYQLLHQGNRAFTADIILPLSNGPVEQDAHRKLAANALAQSRALMLGRSAEEAQQLAVSRGQDARLAPHFEMPGNHPHSLILTEAVTPATLGALIAAYEHKTFFLGRLLGINPFDQWGVELGKVIGQQIRSILETGDGLEDLDPATAAAARAWREANR